MMLSPVKIVSDRIYLEELDENRLSRNYVGWMQDPDTIRYLNGRMTGYDEQELEQYVAQMNKSNNNFLFGIFLKDSNEHIGNIKIGNINEIHRFADLGILIGNKNMRGKGYGSEAITLVTEYAFNELNVNKITAGMIVENVASYKSFIKAGYIKAGLLKRHTLYNGRYVDTLLIEKCRDLDQ